MSQIAGRMVGSAFGGAAAATAYALTGPFGLIALASTLGIINVGANWGETVVEAVAEAEPSYDIKISIC